MIVRNEEKTLARCLESAAKLVDEIIIADTGSEDNTVNIALSKGAKVYHYQWNDHFAEARNFAIQQSTSDWNLVLDADEWIEQGSRQELAVFMNSGPSVGRVLINSIFLNDGQESYSQCYTSRLFPRDVYYSGRIHEQLVSKYTVKNTGLIVGHDGYYTSKNKAERNINLLLEEVGADAGNPYLHFQLAKEYYHRKDYPQAAQHYEQSFSKVDKSAGYYPNLVVDYVYLCLKTRDLSKGFEVIQENEARLSDFPDFHFVKGLFYTDYVFSDVQKNLSYLPLIEQSYLQALKVGETDRYYTVKGSGSYAAAYNLGVYYESAGFIDKAVEVYNMAANHDYEPALKRLQTLFEK